MGSQTQTQLSEHTLSIYIIIKILPISIRMTVTCLNIVSIHSMNSNPEDKKTNPAVKRKGSCVLFFSTYWSLKCQLGESIQATSLGLEV